MEADRPTWLPLPTSVLQRHRKRERQKRRRRGLLALLVELPIGLALLSWCGLLWVAASTPVPQGWFRKGTLSLQILDREGRFLYETPAENGRFGTWLPGQQLPRSLQIVTLAAEDHRIYEHRGVDLWAVARAIVGNLSGQKRSGASTLSMQLVRLLQPAPRTYQNKLREMFWALVLQTHLGPKGILREYLNRAPYGNRVQGIQRASLLYFDRPAQDLSLGQAAFLAALPWGPGLLNPFHLQGQRRARRRSLRILRRAYALGMVDKAAYDEARIDPIQIQPRPARDRTSIQLTGRLSRRWKALPKGPLSRRVTSLRTTLDLPYQHRLRRALLHQLPKLRGAGTGALLVARLDDGELLAYLASHSYFDKLQRGAIDYIQTPRAPGSALKPFVYAQAIQSLGYTGASLFRDVASTFLWKQGSYLPQNHDTRFLGPLRLREALGNSRNIPVLRALSAVGVDNALEFLRSLGFGTLHHDGAHYGLGLALGNAEVTLLDLVRAYGILARGGRPFELKIVGEARDSLGRVVARPFPAPPLQPPLQEQPKLKPAAASIIAHILADPIARLPSFGRYGQMEFGFPVAVKTGTSQGHRDAWMVAWSDRLIVGCWIGAHDRRPMGKVYGSKACGPLVQVAMRQGMKRVRRHVPIADFPPPTSWVSRKICPLSGKAVGPACPGHTEEWFPPNKAAALAPCPYHKLLAVDRRNGLRATAGCPPSVQQKRPFVVVPGPLAIWAQAMSFPLPPKPSPLCQHPRRDPIAQGLLSIRRPVDGARYILDPTIPPEYATIALQAESDKSWPQIHWFVNDKLLTKTPWPYTHRWPLKRGAFRFVAKSPDGRVRSSAVQIYVR